MYLRLIYTLSFFFIGIAATGVAQKVDRWQMNASYGSIIAHSRDLTSIANSNPTGIAISFDRMNLRTSSWQKCGCFSRSGLQLSHHNFQNQSILGTATSLSGYFEPVLFRTTRSELSLRNGIGVSYLSKVYDPETNPDNIFFSAPLSFLLFIQPEYTFFISERWHLHISAVYNHISNGGQSQPNRGMNFPMAALGVSFTPSTANFPEFQKPEAPRGWNYTLQVFGTMKTKESDTDTRNLLAGMAVEASYRFSLLNSMGGGLEVAYDASRLSQNEILAPYIAHHFMFGRFDFSQWMAFYLIAPNTASSSFYQRYQLLYEIFPSVSVGGSLKTHGHVAENIDLRVQWKF